MIKKIREIEGRIPLFSNTVQQSRKFRQAGSLFPKCKKIIVILLAFAVKGEGDRDDDRRRCFCCCFRCRPTPLRCLSRSHSAVLSIKKKRIYQTFNGMLQSFFTATCHLERQTQQQKYIRVKKSQSVKVKLPEDLC